MVFTYSANNTVLHFRSIFLRGIVKNGVTSKRVSVAILMKWRLLQLNVLSIQYNVGWMIYFFAVCFTYFSLVFVQNEVQCLPICLQWNVIGTVFECRKTFQLQLHRHTLLLRTEDCSCLYLGFSFGQYGFNINLKHNPKALKAHSTSRRFVLFIFSNGSAGPVTYVTPGPIPIPFPPRSQFIFPIFPMISDCCANRKVPFGNGADIVSSVLVNASLRPCQ